MNFWLKLLSLPSRERGLKPWNEKLAYIAKHVAPFAGAWIETFFVILIPPIHKKSLPSRERGLKLKKTI